MELELKWRQWTAIVVAVVLLAVGGWKIFTAPSPKPTAKAPAGATPRTQDAAEFAPASASQPRLPADTR